MDGLDKPLRGIVGVTLVAYTGRFFGAIAGEAPWEAEGKGLTSNASPSASQADLSKKPTRVRTLVVTL